MIWIWWIDERTDCVETYFFVEGFCIRSEEYKEELIMNVSGMNDHSTYYHGVSEIACEYMCTKLHDMECSGVFYNRQVQAPTLNWVAK